LAGVDAIVFTGGIGEHDEEVRERVCGQFGYLGLQLDSEKNLRGKGEREITRAGSAVRAFVIPTNEELVIARETAELVR
jgi:acetate kinase